MEVNKCCHPLDPLSAAEIKSVSQLVKVAGKTRLEKDDTRFVFNSMCLMEPSKEVLLPLLNESSSMEDTAKVVLMVPRKALVILIEKPTGQVWEVTVNVTTLEIETWKAVEPGFQPTLSPEDCFDAERIARADPNVQARYRELGFDDLELLVGDPWSIGYHVDEGELENLRLVQLFMYNRSFPDDNHYAHPLDFVTIVDLSSERVVRIDNLPATNSWDCQERVPISFRSWSYDPEYLKNTTQRVDLKPIEITQPEGPSFKVDGYQIEWQKFKFRISFNYREGLVIHNVRYEDGTSTKFDRPLFYRLSISEMVVPYGDPRPPFHRKSAFDVGDYGLGYCTNSLELGCDCIGAIKYFDAVLNNHAGDPVVIKNAICLHEEDSGILWKHTEYRTGKVLSARGRRLVLSFIVTVVNYEYAFYWYFNLDGTISFEVKATGQLSTNLIKDTILTNEYGTVVAPSILAQNHQHIFAMRIDPMIDGKLNAVTVVDVVPLAADAVTNPYGQGFKIDKTPIVTTDGNTSNFVAELCRSWLISNNGVRNPMNNQPVAWKLVPSGATFGKLMALEGSTIRNRAMFATKSFWVTKYHNSVDELHAGGFYVNQSKGGQGLPMWSQPRDGQAEYLWDQDVVLWHVFGVTHIPRVEDFPIMNVESCGFSLKPFNFFQTNPAIDVPHSTKEKTKSKEVCCQS